MNSMKVKDLREIAKFQGLRGYSRLKKSDLISFIKNNENHSSDRATEVAMKVWRKTIKELKDIAALRSDREPTRAKSFIFSERITAKGEELLTRKDTDYGTRTSGRTKRLSDGVGKSTRRNAPEDLRNLPLRDSPERR